jgi:acyl-CoA hydrolase
MGEAPYVHEKFREKFKMNSFFIAENVRDALEPGDRRLHADLPVGDPDGVRDGRIPIDVALISVTPPDVNGLCSLGVSVDIVKSAAANARYVIAQVNSRMPRTLGNSFLHVNTIDVLVPHDEPMIEVAGPQPDETLRRIGQNVARLVEDGSTIECGIGRIPQALAEFLVYKKDLGVHTEMFSDWIIDLIECGAITCAKKSHQPRQDRRQLLHGLAAAVRLRRQQPVLRVPPHRVRQRPFVIAQHDKMVASTSGWRST